MKGLVAAFFLVFVLVNTVVGVRLFGRWKRTRQVPELLLASALLLSATLGYPLIVVGTAMPQIGVWSSLLGLAAFQLGVSCYAFFNARVFRPGVRWASVLASGCTHIFAAVFAVSLCLAFAAESVVSMANALGPFLLLNQCTLLAISLWTALEGGRYYRLMTRRAALGLADPLIVNRFLLWTILGSLHVTNMLFALVLMWSGQNVAASTASIAFTSVNGLVASVFTVLIFMPPAWYVRKLSPAAVAPGVR